MYVRYVKALEGTSASVIIDAAYHQDQNVKLNRSLISIRIGPTVKNFSLVYKVVHLASVTVLILISNKSRWKVHILWQFVREILCSCIQLSMRHFHVGNRTEIWWIHTPKKCCAVILFYGSSYNFIYLCISVLSFFTSILTKYDHSSYFGNFNFQFSYLYF